MFKTCRTIHNVIFVFYLSNSLPFSLLWKYVLIQHFLNCSTDISLLSKTIHNFKTSMIIYLQQLVNSNNQGFKFHKNV